MAGYEIQFITDGRFGGTKEELVQMDKELKESLKELSGVRLVVARPIYEIDWSKESPEEPFKQWRIIYRVYKDSREVSWNEVMGRINKIYAPFYKKI